ncbi:ABC transporter permease [Catenuloplanes niger JCM 9533]|uniref:ABC-2 type transport system permease protein n=1 Tax=Catenuloplanes niger TaxID=587534 RepID=A0AAE3ZQA5_9ACTN|nr:ABC-2 type transport system permease protein [Catenuloplanes niger]
MTGRQLSNWEATRLVTARELKVKIRDKAFLISTAFLLVFAIAGTVVPSLIGGSASSVAVVAGTPTDRLAAVGLEVREVPDAAEAERLVRAGEVDSAVVDGVVLAMQEAPDEVVSALSTAPEVRLLEADAVSGALAFLVPYLFAMVFFFTSLMFGLQIAQSITEEKQTRIVEILVSSVPPRVMLAGKVLAGTILAFGQIALLALVSIGGMRLSGGEASNGVSLLNLLAPAIGWFLPFFVVGFVLLAAMWAVTGALVSRQEDINSVSTPVQLAVMLPFFGVIFLSGNPLAMTIMSYVPFSAPIAMPVRLFTEDAAVWEPFVALALLVLAAAAMLVAAARLYEGSLLRTNGKTSLGTAWRSREALPR